MKDYPALSCTCREAVKLDDGGYVMVVERDVYVYTAHEDEGECRQSFLHWPLLVELAGGIDNITLYHCCVEGELTLSTGDRQRPPDHSCDMLVLLQRLSC